MRLITRNLRYSVSETTNSETSSTAKTVNRTNYDRKLGITYSQTSLNSLLLENR